MIKYIQTDILSCDSEALVNTVNTEGVMGKGIALQFKEKFPLNFKLYQKACKLGEVKTGKMFITSTGTFDNPKYIINFPTKTNWRSSSRLEYIDEGLKDLFSIILDYKIQSIAIPPLGCGNGGLNWQDVKPLIEYRLQSLSTSVEIVVIEPGHHSYARTTLKEAPELTKARALVLALVDAYRVLGFDISHLEIQKLAYFLQAFGQDDLKLKFQKGTYGPYALNLKHLLAFLEGYYIKGQIRFQDMKPIDPLFLNEEKLPDVRKYLETTLSQEETTRLIKVTKFIEGFESPFGLELLATVFWAKIEESASDLESVFRVINDWSQRKCQIMKHNQVQIALDRINQYF